MHAPTGTMIQTPGARTIVEAEGDGVEQVATGRLACATRHSEGGEDRNK